MDTLKHLVEMDVDWSKVEMFHLDEYIDFLNPIRQALEGISRKGSLPWWILRKLTL